MSLSSTNELRDFHRFVGEKVANGGASQSPEDVLDEWRTLHPECISEEEIAAIQEAIDDMAAGDTGIPFEEFNREFRARRLPPQA